MGFPPGVRRDAADRSLLGAGRLGRHAGRIRLRRLSLPRPLGRINDQPRKESTMALSPATKRYNLRMIWLWLLYAAFLLPAVYSFKHRLVSGEFAYVLAILPAIPIIGVF